MQTNKKEVGLRIKAIRQERGMNLEEFGKLFNVSKSNVSHWESGNTLPNSERLKAIAKIGDMTVDELLYGKLEEQAFTKLIKSVLGEDEVRKFHSFITHNILDTSRSKNNYNIRKDTYYKNIIKKQINSYNIEIRDHLSETKDALKKLLLFLTKVLNDYDAEKMDDALQYFKQTNLTEDELELIKDYILFLSNKS